ncbi:uncharacterized protein LOC123315929 [Coccinella septempunctata]|uniref:uncharacterized protein LOC123315929 n=1 Tax=Coccinella septempunctata TaxID=41139 RepID=UPI001D0855D7|nr:uncharacterized protein LOC123315929 [Coccinella septempunctata]
MEADNINMRFIQDNYPEDIARTFKRLWNTKKQRAKQKNRRIFLLQCKNAQLCPTFLKLKLQHIKFLDKSMKINFDRAVSKFQLRTLNLLLTDTTKHLRKLEAEIRHTESELKSIQPSEHIRQYLNIQNCKIEETFKKVQSKQIKKLQKLKNKNSNTNTTHTEWVTNLTDTDIPETVLEILSLGPNYGMEYKTENIPITDIVASLETGIINLEPEIQSKIRTDITNTITNFKNKNPKRNREQDILNKKIKETTTFLKNNPQLKILKPDKSNKTVIMNNSDYKHKILEHLNDKKTYKKLNRDPTQVIQRKNNEIVKNWETKNLLPKKLCSSLKIHNAVPPQFYGLPKLHKDNIPLRPIVSCIQGPTYNLSKYLSKCISPIIGQNAYHIKDSWTFKQFIDTVNLNEDERLVSFDVVSLYTNTPMEKAKDIISKRWDEIKNHTDLTKVEFMKAIDFCITNSYFQFEDSFYSQIDGCSMGNPLSSVLAELVMEDLEKTIIEKLIFKINFFKRYVDDCITAIAESHITPIINELNNYHPKLKFTVEIEKNNRINFLDMTLIHDNNGSKIETIWHTKETCLKIHNAVPPQFYGLPKLHKDNIPLRPIVSCIQGPTYNLSKYLSKCISPIIGQNAYHIKDSWTFKQFIDTVNLNEDERLVSFDVITDKAM